MYDRAFRRAHRQRLAHQRYLRDRLNQAWSAFPANYDTERKTSGLLARTPKRCSSPYCANPRRIHRNADPRQEYLAKQCLKDQYRSWIIGGDPADPVPSLATAPRLHLKSSRF